MINNNKFIEYRYYDTEYGRWYYGNVNGNGVMINTLEGLRKIKEKRKDVISFYINVDEEKRKERRIKDVSEEEWNRRELADKKDFYNVENEVDYVIDNNVLEDSVDEIKKILTKNA